MYVVFAHVYSRRHEDDSRLRLPSVGIEGLILVSMSESWKPAVGDTRGSHCLETSNNQALGARLKGSGHVSDRIFIHSLHGFQIVFFKKPV